MIDYEIQVHGVKTVSKRPQNGVEKKRKTYPGSLHTYSIWQISFNLTACRDEHICTGFYTNVN